MTLRIMSFNLRFATAPDGPHAWPHRRELVPPIVQTFAPDVLGTQECLVQQRDFLAEHLPGYEVVGVGRDDGEMAGEMAAIFYRRARFDRLDQGHFWLSERPDVPGSKSWDCSNVRMASWVSLRDREQPKQCFHLFNTHLDERSALGREHGARLIREHASRIAPQSPLILTGDFNCPPGSKPYQTLTCGLGEADLPWRDTYASVHPDPVEPQGTFHGFTGRPDAHRIDWILASPHFAVEAAGIDRSGVRGQWPSDHFAVTTILSSSDARSRSSS